MVEAEKYRLALSAVLFAASRCGCDLEALSQTVRDDIVGNNPLRPSPLDQDAVLKTVATAVQEVSECLR